MLLTTPAAAKLSVWMVECGCFQPISVRVLRCETMACAMINILPSSASDADATTNLIICAIVSTGPFHFGTGSSSERKVCAPALLLPRLSFCKPASY